MLRFQITFLKTKKSLNIPDAKITRCTGIQFQQIYKPICLGTNCGATVGPLGLSGLGTAVGLMLGIGYPPNDGTVPDPTNVPWEPAVQLIVGQHCPLAFTMLHPKGRFV